MKKNKNFLRTFLAVVCIVASFAVTFSIGAANVFVDVSPTKDAWCYTQVMKAYNMGLINGYGNGYFGKNDPITRGQIVQILYNHYGTDVGSNSGFSDVPADAWYAKAVTWAAKNGVVSGYSNGTFGPNNKLTREQMVTILYNVAGRPSADTSMLAPFTDRGDVASYAVPGFSWAVSNGIVSGTSTTTLSPRGTATRAQVAVIMIRYIEKFEGEVPEYVPDPEPTPGTESRNADGTTNAAYVNSISGVNKDAAYPTTGAASSPNANGFYTEADVDIEGCALQYDALAYLNAFLDENGLAHAMWTVNDEVEEYTLVRAKEAYVNFAHERIDGSGKISTENLYKGNGSTSGVINAWKNSTGHNGTMKASSGDYVCVARYKTCWILTVWSPNSRQLQDVVAFSSSNYYYD